MWKLMSAPELLLVLLQRVGTGTLRRQMLAGLELIKPCVWQQISKRTQTANSRTEDLRDALPFGDLEPKDWNMATPAPPCCGHIKYDLEVSAETSPWRACCLHVCIAWISCLIDGCLHFLLVFGRLSCRSQCWRWERSSRRHPLRPPAGWPAVALHSPSLSLFPSVMTLFPSLQSCAKVWTSSFHLFFLFTNILEKICSVWRFITAVDE